MIHPVLVNPVISPLVDALDPVVWRAGSSYPAALALLYDADKAPTRELTGKGHKFNSAILSPQYQRNADGSYTDVGANPAVDSFDGEKWLRSCGAVTNLSTTYPSDPTFGTSGALTKTIVSDGVRLQANGSGVCLKAFTVLASNAYTVSLWVKNNGGTEYKSRVYNVNGSSEILQYTSYFSQINSLGFTRIDITFATPIGCTSVYLYLGVSQTGDVVDVVLRDMLLLTATAYPVPYTPPGTTMPASNATTTNGCWFTLADGSPVWKALTGEPLTLATRVRMGAGSGDLAVSNHTAAVIATPGYVDFYQYWGGVIGGMKSDCSSSAASAILSVWSRNSIFCRVVQVNTAGTQFRVGYMIEGTHTVIQWGSWTTYDGNFTVSTLFKLMLGYNNAYPMWYSKIAVWGKQCTDAEILEALK